MGHHHYCRICVNGNKIRSVGDMNKKIINEIESKNINPFNYIDKFLINNNYSLESVPTDIRDIEFIFIKRHVCHKNRTIYRTDQFIYDEGKILRHVKVTHDTPDNNIVNKKIKHII